MCGIAGIGLQDHQGSVPTAQLEAMSSWLRQRGPDDAGIWTGLGVGLAHRRLAIIDLSAAGHQPMLADDGSVAIVFNGEIYGFLDLRKELESDGVKFRSRSDTEVLIHGYLTWGMDRLLERMDGMFAFALFDTRQRFLYLARDRFGQKPLYYALSRDRVHFASDIRSIWAVKDGLNLDFEALDYYLSELSMPQPRTIWKEIQQVEPATCLRIRLDRLGQEVRRYWRVPRPEPTSAGQSELVNGVEERLATSIRRMRIADVPIGSFLSGGIDSGLVTSFLAGEKDQPVRTYTIGFPGAKEDERAAARSVADRLGTMHTELNAEAITPELVRDLSSEYGEPFADSSGLATYLVSRAMREHCRVVLSGDGGDEIFGGYWEYPTADFADAIRREHPGTFPQLPLRGWDSIARRIGFSGLFSAIGVGHALDFAHQPGYQILHRGMGFHPDRLDDLYLSGASNGFARRELDRQWNSSLQSSTADTLFEASLSGRLLNDYLVKVDRASMACSLEVRIPFLDRALVEFAFKLPAAEKLPRHQAKGLLKSLADKRLGKDISRSPKKGFALPLGMLLRRDFRELLSDHLSAQSVRARGLFRADAVDSMLSAHIAGHADHEHRIWCLLSFELWCCRFLDREGSAQDP